MTNSASKKETEFVVTDWHYYLATKFTRRYMVQVECKKDSQLSARMCLDSEEEAMQLFYRICY